MSTGRASPLAAAFLWAVTMGAGMGLADALIFHKQPRQTANNMALTAGVAAVVAYNERKDALDPK